MNVCGLCGKALLRDQLVWDNELATTICKEHAPLLRTCFSCRNLAQCLYETDPSPLPKVILRTIQQGNMQVQTQTRNPEREEITCKKCPCYHEEFGCWRTIDQSFCHTKNYVYGGR